VDVIELRDLRLLAICGVLPEERDRLQPISIDLDIEIDLGAAGVSDDLAGTVDYGAVTERVATAAATGFHLLEALAESVSRAVLADPRVDAVTVAVRKLRPPVPVDLGSAGVRIRRTRTI
jgi:FolB domain-containing protein